MKNFISLEKPWLRLWLEENNNEWVAWLEKLEKVNGTTEITKKEIFDVCLNGIFKQCRFGNQIHSNFTVGDHTLLLETFMSKVLNSDKFIVRQVLLHDIHEGIWLDVPRPFKTEEMKKIEKAITKALPWEECWNQERCIKHWDWIACIVEATKYNPSWPWVKIESDTHHDDVEKYSNWFNKMYPIIHTDICARKRLLEIDAEKLGLF